MLCGKKNPIEKSMSKNPENSFENFSYNSHNKNKSEIHVKITL